MVKNYIRNGILGGLGFLMASGCLATKDYVNEREAMLQDKVSTLEKKISVYDDFFAHCTDNRYDNDARCIDQKVFAKMREGVYRLNNFAIFIDKNDEFSLQNINEGSATGIVLESGHVLTVAHSLELPPLIIRKLEKEMNEIAEKQGRPAGLRYFNMDSSIKDDGGKNHWLIDIKIHRTKDIAISRIKDYDKGKFSHLSVKIGDSDELKPGDKIYMVGDDLGKGIRLREAIVSRKCGLNYKFPNLLDYDFFTVSTDMRSGSSGGPVFAIRDGQPELVGLTSTVEGSIMGINMLKDLQD